MLVVDAHGDGDDAAIELWNSDGSRSEISGNGTRCAAALLVEAGQRRRTTSASAPARASSICACWSATGMRFIFEMNMGAPRDRGACTRP